MATRLRELETTKRWEPSQLRLLAGLYGIDTSWSDQDGVEHEVDDLVLTGLLDAQGIKAHSPSEVELSLLNKLNSVVEPVCATSASEAPVQLPVVVPEGTASISVTLNAESGDVQEAVIDLNQADLPVFAVRAGEHVFFSLAIGLPWSPAPGYHELIVKLNDSAGNSLNAAAKTLLIVAPERSYLCEALEQKEWLWGPAVNPTTLRSERSWLAWDFTDLKELISWSADHGAGTLSLEPVLSATGQKRNQYPAALVGRMFMDPVFVDPEQIADFAEAEEVRRRVLAPAFQKELSESRNGRQIDYLRVLQAKLPVLKELFEHFRRCHRSTGDERARQFEEFCREGGEDLRIFATYAVLAEQFGPRWQDWPEAYRNPAGEQTLEFAKRNGEEIEFFMYLQWQADIQLAAAGQLCLQRHMPVGLCISFPSGLSDAPHITWVRQHFLARPVVLAAPNGAQGAAGDASIPVVIPEKMRHERYRLFIDSLRSHMRHAGALRVNASFLQEKQFWALDPDEPANGAFVRMPGRELAAILVVESHRQRCVLIGCNGINGNGKKNGTTRNTILHSWPGLEEKALISNRDEDGQLITPTDSAIRSAIRFDRPELPAFVDYWCGQDLNLKVSDPDFDIDTRDRPLEQRVLSRIEILRLLEGAGLLPEEVTTDPASVPAATPDLVSAFYTFMSSAPSLILLISLEDVARLNDSQTLNLTTLRENGWMEDLLKRIREKRGSYYRFLKGEMERAARQSCIIPRASYRLQINGQFNLTRAKSLIPYLAGLGVSHIYASPLLRARLGSTHGYDIIDHNHLNPEIGNDDDFNSFVDELRRHGMGLILDLVPNHMGIGKENPWWFDVLENGAASEYADYFDIDWCPVKAELRKKVLLPVLGQSYGRVLMDGQLNLSFNPVSGALRLKYFEHEFPLNPVSYPLVLGLRLDTLKERLGREHPDVQDYLSILTALKSLPDRPAPPGYSERVSEKHVQQRRLAALCGKNEAIAAFIEQNLAEFRIQDSHDRTAFKRLHDLLEAQIYRLSYWAVASDEINYRRFFDINDLAALRTEDPRVFADTHGLVLKWIKEKKLDGLRIDHVDGLLDPVAYINSLQEAAAGSLGIDYDQQRITSQESLPIYVVVEKILQPFEHLQEELAVHGTTGYDFLKSANDLLVMTPNEKAFTEAYETFTGKSVNYDGLRRACKKIILETALAGELNVLAHRLSRIAEASAHFRDFTLNAIRNALSEVVTCFPVYRTYLPSDEDRTAADQFIDWAIALAKRDRDASNVAVFDFVRSVLKLEQLEEPAWASDGEEPTPLQQKVKLFALQFQQFTSPVMAKSVEDTLFYRYNRFIALNEVGGEPKRFGASVSAFHHQNLERRQHRPYELLASSTHDTKRSEDFRARLAVLSELPELWGQKIEFWSGLNQAQKTILHDGPAPDANDEYFLYQTMAGVSPLDLSDSEQLDSFRERLEKYAVKAVREAKLHTSWVSPNQEYEQALLSFIRQTLSRSDKNFFFPDFLEFQKKLSQFGLLNSLVQTLLKLTSPGIPDIYQGCEHWDFSMVDPDNRRPVDFDRRMQCLTEMESLIKDFDSTQGFEQRQSYLNDCLRNWHDSRIKQAIIAIALRERRRNSNLFSKGDYLAVEVEGPAQEHVIAFARSHENEWALVACPLNVAALLDACGPGWDDAAHPGLSIQSPDLWRDTAIIPPAQMPVGQLTNVFTGQSLGSNRVPVFDLFQSFPLALYRSNSK